MTYNAAAVWNGDNIFISSSSHRGIGIECLLKIQFVSSESAHNTFSMEIGITSLAFLGGSPTSLISPASGRKLIDQRSICWSVAVTAFCSTAFSAATCGSQFGIKPSNLSQQTSLLWRDLSAAFWINYTKRNLGKEIADSHSSSAAKWRWHLERTSNQFAFNSPVNKRSCCSKPVLNVTPPTSTLSK